MNDYKNGYSRTKQELA